MFDPEHNQYEEYSFRPPEVTPPPEEMYRAEEHSCAQEYQAQEEMNTSRGDAEHKQAENKENKSEKSKRQHNARARSGGMQAIQMVAMTVVAAAVVTVAAATSDGAFLPGLGAAATQAYERVAALPLSEPGPKMDVQQVVLAFSGQTVTVDVPIGPDGGESSTGESGGGSQNTGPGGTNDRPGVAVPSETGDTEPKPEPNPKLPPEPNPKLPPEPGAGPPPTPGPSLSTAPRPGPPAQPQATPEPGNMPLPVPTPIPEPPATPSAEPTPTPVPTPTHTETPLPPPSVTPTPLPSETPEPPPSEKPKPPTHYHSYAESVTTPATCVAAGVKTYTCYCGSSYTGPIPATGIHTWDGGVETAPATCAAEGVKTYACTECAAAYTEAIPMVAHIWGAWTNTNDPTNHTHTCTVCRTATETEAHTLTDTVIAPTCTVAGYTEHGCACGYTMQDTPVTALGHSYEAWVDTADGTNHTKTCSRGDDTVTEAHVWDGTWAYTDSFNHKQTCTACAAVKTEGHTLTNLADEGGTFSSGHTADCNVCGKTGMLFSHSWNVYRYGDDSIHWVYCACGAASNANEPHRYNGEGVCPCGATNKTYMPELFYEGRFLYSGTVARPPQTPGATLRLQVSGDAGATWTDTTQDLFDPGTTAVTPTVNYYYRLKNEFTVSGSTGSHTYQFYSHKYLFNGSALIDHG